MRAAAAVELIHMATLVHDDVVDDAMLRRGRPTVFAATAARPRQRPATSCSRARLRCSRRTATPSRCGCSPMRASRSLAASSRSATMPTGSDVDEQRYMLRCELKTASLFAAACMLGALAAGRPAAETQALESYGRRLGLAFQLLDDVLDVSGPEERTGKHRGTDLLDGTVTLPLILADLGLSDLRTVTSREAAEALCDRIAATGALDETRTRATALVARGEGQRCAATSTPTLGRSLTDVADRIAERYA